MYCPQLMLLMELVVIITYIAEFWASKLSYLLNTHSYSCDELGNLINASVSPSTLFDLCVTAGDVGRALVKHKLGKSDCDFLSSDHLHYASAVIATPLAAYFTSILADPFIKCKSYCLSLYGSQLWNLSNIDLQIVK